MEKSEETKGSENVDVKKADLSQESESESDDCQEEIDLDDIPEADDYKPPFKVGEDGEELDDDDDDVSSGEEEVGVHVQEITMGKCKLMKLTFDDVEEKRKEYEHQLLSQSDSETSDDNDEDKENLESTSQHKDGSEKAPKHKVRQEDYRQLLDEDMDQYNSEEDDNFNPVYCGDTLSDVEYEDDDERNTESEPEVEEQEGHEKHKKTGEPLVCIRMMEQLELPPDCGMAAAAVTSNQEGTSQSAMECA